VTADKPSATGSPSRAVFNSANSAQAGEHEGRHLKPAESQPFGFESCAELELKITIANMNLQLERGQLEHWKRELDKYNPDLYRLALLSGQIKPTGNTWNGYQQQYNATSYDQALVTDMLGATHREVLKLQNEVSAMEWKLREIMGPAVKNYA
jgi:hypothetical protein